MDRSNNHVSESPLRCPGLPVPTVRLFGWQRQRAAAQRTLSSISRCTLPTKQRTEKQPLLPPPIIERRHRNAVALAKLPPRQPTVVKLPENVPHVVGASLFAHAPSSAISPAASRWVPRTLTVKQHSDGSQVLLDAWG